MSEQYKPFLIQTRPLGGFTITSELRGVEQDDVPKYLAEIGKAFQLAAVSYDEKTKTVHLRFAPGNGTRTIIPNGGGK